MNRVLSALVALSAAACAPAEPATWYGDVEVVAAERCVRCHNPGGIGSFLDLTDGPTAVTWSEAIRSAVEERRMPPFPAEGGACEPEGGFLHDPRLTEDERALILEWAANGAPLGERTEVPPEPVVDTLEDVSAELTIDGEVRVPPADELSDAFVCLILDPALDRAVWLDAFEVDPDVAEVVHHVLVNSASREAALARDAEDGSLDGTYPCFSGVDLAGSKLVGGWIPGAAPLRYPEGSGIRLDPTELLVVQMHYHGIGTEQFDRSALKVHWVETAPAHPAVLTLNGNARTAAQGLLPGPNDASGVEFRIPAGAVGHTETSRHPIDIPDGVIARPFMVSPHMHLVGTGLTAWLEHEDGSRECLIDVPRYDFDWQLFYFLDPEVTSRVASAGDSIVVECTYDNVSSNPSVGEALLQAGLDAPIDVELGEGTLDEMCLVAIGAVPERAP